MQWSLWIWYCCSEFSLMPLICESQCFFPLNLSLWPKVLPQGLQHACPLLHALIKMFKRKTFFSNIPMPLLFIYLFLLFFSVVLSLGPDNPQHPLLISGKATGQHCGLSFKNACSSSEHTLQLTREQAFSLLWGREPQADKNSTPGNDMHDYRLHAHTEDQCWRWGHFLRYTERKPRPCRCEVVYACAEIRVC